MKKIKPIHALLFAATLVLTCKISASWLFENEQKTPLAAIPAEHLSHRDAPAVGVDNIAPAAEAAPAAEPPLTESLISEYEQANHNPAYPNLASRYEEIKARRPDSHLTPSQLVIAVAEDSAWEPTSQLPEAQLLLDELNITDPALMRFNSAKVESLVIGDVLDIPIPQAGTSYRLRIESIQPDATGTLTWRGHILFQGKNYYASITRNREGLTIGGINTPHGHFTLEAHNDAGWISASQNSFHNAAEVDFIVPRFE